MGYIKIRFGDEFLKSEADVHKSVADMFRAVNPAYAPSQHIWRPHMDIYETPQQVIVLAELSGIKKENIQLEVSSRAIRIFGKRYEAALDKNVKYRLAEICYGYFERTLSMPAPIDTGTVMATYAEGLLHIKMSKLPHDRKHKIAIQEL